MSLIKSTNVGSSGDAPFYNDVANKSLRFGVNNYLRNELDAPTSTQKLTLSMWIKRQRVGTEEAIAGTNVDNNYIRFEAGGTIRFRDGSINLITTPLYRDTSAWYNIAVVWDLTNTTDADKVKIYVNGIRQALGTSTLPSAENVISQFNVDGKEHYIGAYRSGGVVGYYSGYIAEVNFIDGINIGETSGYLDEFGELKNGVWIPKDTSGLTFGDNGYRLQFANSAVSSASSSTIGADTSGKARHFTSAGIVASDCNMPDSPENNFCTLNSNAKFQQGTLSEGSLKFVGDGGNNWDEISSTFAVSSGKWYWEVQFLTIQQLNSNIAGIRQTATQLKSDGKWYGGSTAVSNIGVVFGVMDVNGLVTNADGSGTLSMAIAAEDIVQFRLDLDDNELSVSVDGTDKGKAWDITANIEYTPSSTVYNSSSVIYNFGQDSTFLGDKTATTNSDANGFGEFHSAVPSGYLALCTGNLTEPDIGSNSGADEQSTDYFNTVLWTGNNNARSIDDVGFQPDFVWSKCRNTNSTSHRLHDSVRGDNGTVMLELNSDSTAAEGNDTLISGFDAEGFNIAAGGNHPNVTNRTFVAWNWKLGGAPAATNSAGVGATPTANSVKIDGANKGDALAGSIMATKISASTKAGVSIVTYTGTGTAGTVAHGLGTIPQWYIVKCLDNSSSSDNWYVYHSGVGANPEDSETYLNLNLEAFFDSNLPFNEIKPTDSVFSIKTLADVNQSGKKYIAYCFSDREGFSKFGRFIGTGDADGSFIYTGFKPAFVIIKCTSVRGGSWFMLDNKRDISNEVLQDLTADTDNDETTNSNFLDFLSNGFKLRTTGSVVNGSGRIMIYMAFAEAPFKYANAE